MTFRVWIWTKPYLPTYLSDSCDSSASCDSSDSGDSSDSCERRQKFLSLFFSLIFFFHEKKLHIFLVNKIPRKHILWPSKICDKTKKKSYCNKTKISTYDKTQKLKLWHTRNTQILTKLTNSKCDKLKNSNWEGGDYTLLSFFIHCTKHSCLALLSPKANIVVI